MSLIAIAAFILGVICAILGVQSFHIHLHPGGAPVATKAMVPKGESGLNKFEHEACIAHQTFNDGCGVYHVSSYDATWRNNLGNEGRFELERDGLRIRAHCGGENCYRWIDAVGKTVEADKSVTDLITYHLPDCEDPDYVKNALTYYKRVTGRDASVGQVCDQPLIVEKIEAK